jgi:hypothetical protein
MSDRIREDTTPIFIHSFWRSGGTYVWAKFREHAGYRAYYEPFHEALATLSPCPDNDADSIALRTRQRHPPLGAPYFAEYPFRPGGGVEGFERRFSYDRYSLNPSEPDDALRRYIARLIAFAGAHRQVPVFKFCRSLLRVGWLARTFRSRNVLVLRRPIDIWRSCRDQGITYYAPAVCAIVGRNRQHPLLATLADRYNISASSESCTDMRVYRDYAVKNWLDLFAIFSEFYLLACLHDFQYADCIIDMNAVTADPAARQTVSHALAALGIDLCLDDVAMAAHRDLSRSERVWLRQEAMLRRRLADRLPASLRLSRDRWREHAPLLSPYYREALEPFVESASRS